MLRGNVSTLLAVVWSCVLLGACSSGSQHQDLHNYIAEAKQKPGGQIEPLPPFVPYKSFTYSAMAMRGPFDPPVTVGAAMAVGRETDVEPDLTREKEFLESFNLANLKMVGSLQRDGQRWALIDDGEGGVHRVAEGNYLGMNHGRIVATNSRKIDVIEIVPTGTGSWVERPQVLEILEEE